MSCSDPALCVRMVPGESFPLKVHVVSLDPPELQSVSGFGHWVLKELRKLNRGLVSGPDLIWGGRYRKRKSRPRHVPRAGDTGRR